MASEIIADQSSLARALGVAGQNDSLRNSIFDLLREAEAEADNPDQFREEVRWPLILSLLDQVKTHRVVLENGLVFEVSPNSRIERALLLSPAKNPDHVWEPQTTKLLTTIASGALHVIVGGAYIGDQVLPMAQSAANGGKPRGFIHAFEPMERAYNQLVRNLELNQITNVVTHRMGLWDHSDVSLSLDGYLALASSVPIDQVQGAPGEVVRSITIDSYVHSQQLPKVDLIMLDTEGGEEQALRGATELLSRPWPESPHIVFEVHRHFTDWSEGLENTPIVQLLTSHNYTVFAIRDFHSNYPMAGYPVEIIPVDCVYLEGPPHGFNLLATKEPDLVRRLGLRIVKNVSPKLLLNRDPALHQPVHNSL